MGYACPVCEDPQADGEHLANHLAFSAMLGNADHERWLDEHAPGWADADPEKLADVVTDHADETEYPQVFEDTTESGGHGHDHAHDQHPAEDSSGPAPEDVLQGASPGEVPDPSELYDDAADRDTDDVLAEARELTRQRRDNASETEEGTDADGDDEDDSDGAAASEGDGDAASDGDDAADDADD